MIIWPKEAKEPFIIGVCDDNTGKVLNEWIIQPGEVIPVEALKLWKAAMDKGDFVPELDFCSAPFFGSYDRKIAEKLLIKQ